MFFWKKRKNIYLLQLGLYFLNLSLTLGRTANFIYNFTRHHYTMVKAMMKFRNQEVLAYLKIIWAYSFDELNV